ncbi:helix-turn-helix transcriptional regulator [Lysinibacillus fusiformis]|uniref:helix-turn-helix transcriptional regulator n=1 Tax=Lysinibacillus fusiformis TaxID=28031 RepID=UPI0034E1A6AF
MRDWLKVIRQIQGVKQEEVAASANISRSYYANIERGNKTPSVLVAKKIANYLKFEWSKFY